MFLGNLSNMSMKQKWDKIFIEGKSKERQYLLRNQISSSCIRVSLLAVNVAACLRSVTHSRRWIVAHRTSARAPCSVNVPFQIQNLTEQFMTTIKKTANCQCWTLLDVYRECKQWCYINLFSACVQRQVDVTFVVNKKEYVLKLVERGKMNSKKLECFNDDDSVDEKLNLSFLGMFFICTKKLLKEIITA